MPKSYPTQMIQPPGKHNPPYPCIHTDHVKEYLSLPFDYLLPPQSDFLPYLEDDGTNIVVAAATSSGKTVIAELFAARAIKLGRKVLYIAPMKALADQKYDDWTNPSHTFFKHSIEILTGDFTLTEQKREKLMNANIIIMTPEMFNSKCRFYSKHEWIHNSVFIGDEIHLISSKNRGDSEEVGIVQYHENSPSSRILFLSATLPNVDDFGTWLTHLSGKPSKIIKSDYRPTKLEIHFEEIAGNAEYSVTETRRMYKTIEIIKRHPGESVIAFVGSKKFGYDLCLRLEKEGIKHYFHNADLERDKRIKIANDFISGDLKVLVATSGMAWGLNSPAINVIMCHTAFGLTPMDPSNINQAIGRAGRSGWSDTGRAYIIVAAHKKDDEQKRIFSDYKIESTLTDVNTLMFHVLSYINDGVIKNAEHLYDWHKKTLASVQGQELTLETSEKVLKALAAKKMIVLKEDGYRTNDLGKITSQMYMSPLDVGDWFENFSKLKAIIPPPGYDEEDEEEINANVAMALANCFNFGATWNFSNGKYNLNQVAGSYISDPEKKCPEVIDLAHKRKLSIMENPQLKYAAVFNAALNGVENISMPLRNYQMTITKDIERTIATLMQCDERVGNVLKNLGKIDGFGWGKQWLTLANRIRYSVRHHLSEIVTIPQIGKVRAEKLFAAGIKNKKDFLDKADVCKKAIGEKTYLKAVSASNIEEED
jgi:replicative superfamily II helicase